MTNRAAFHRARHPGKGILNRSKNSITFDNGDGTKTTVLTIAPLHKGQSGFNQASEIDTAWQPDTGAWQYRFDGADFLTQTRDIFNVGGLMRFTDPASGEWVEFDPQSLNWINTVNSREQIAIKQAVVAQVNDYTINFPDAWGTGRHFRYEAHATRLGKVITIDSPGNLPSPTITGTIWLETEFSLSTSSGVDIYLDGQLWQKTNGVRVQTGNIVEFRDSATGQAILWSLEYPRAWDSGTDTDTHSTVVNGQFEFRRQGGPGALFVTLRIPKTWIDNATFPISIDPTTVFSSAGDGMVAASQSTWDATHDANPGDTVDYTSAEVLFFAGMRQYNPSLFGIWRSSFPFDTSSIPDTDTITAATLNIKWTSVENTLSDAYDYVAVVNTTVASASSLVVADYDNIGDAVDNPTKGSANVDYSSLTTAGSYTSISLNPTGLTWVDPTGTSWLGLRDGRDIEDVDPGSNSRNRAQGYASEQTGTSDDPYLEVTHSGGRATKNTDQFGHGMWPGVSRMFKIGRK